MTYFTEYISHFVCIHTVKKITQKGDNQGEELDIVLLLLVHKCAVDLCRTCTSTGCGR
jgi:hypothetical protein